MAPRIHLSFPTFPNHECTRVAEMSSTEEAILRREVTGVYRAIFEAIDAYGDAHPNTRLLACTMAAHGVLLALQEEGEDDE